MALWPAATVAQESTERGLGTKMAKTNSLGNFIRNRRKEVGYPDLTSFARHLSCSVSYMSRIELGNSDGPSLKFLGEIAQALQVDVKRLVRMKEQDNESGQLVPVDDGGEGHDGASNGIYLEAVVRNAVSVLDPSSLNDLAETSLPDVERLDVQADLKALGKAHLDVAEKFLAQKLEVPAMEQMMHALKAYELLRDEGGIGFTCFNLGRAHRRLVNASAPSPSGRLHHLIEAGSWFRRANAALTNDPERLSDEHRERIAECTSQWARSDEQIASLFVNLINEIGDEFGDAVVQAREGLRESARTLYLVRARAKRQTALAQSNAWIEQLNLRNNDIKKVTGATRRKNTFLLAEAYQRLGVLHRDLAFVETDNDVRSHIHWSGFLAFNEALQLRRTLVGDLYDPVTTAQSLDRLANTHGDFGYSLMLHKGGTADAATVREEAYWQFKVARTLYGLLGMADDDPPVEFVDGHLSVIQREQGLDSDIISRRRIEELIARSDFGTKEKPAFGYPLLYCLDIEQVVAREAEAIDGPAA